MENCLVKINLNTKPIYAKNINEFIKAMMNYYAEHEFDYTKENGELMGIAIYNELPVSRIREVNNDIEYYYIDKDKSVRIVYLNGIAEYHQFVTDVLEEVYDESLR